MLPQLVAALVSHGGDEPAVDDEVRAGDVAGAVAGEQQDEVGHLFGTGEPPVTASEAACLATASASVPQPLDRPVPFGEQGPDRHPQGLRQERRVALGRHEGGACAFDLLDTDHETPERLERCSTLRPFLRLASLSVHANMGEHRSGEIGACRATVARTGQMGA